MTTKDRQQIAAAVKRHFGVDEKWRRNKDCDWAIRLFVGNLMEIMEKKNPNFNRVKFFVDCGF